MAPISSLFTSSVMSNKPSIRIETFARWNTGGQIGTNVENGIVKSIWCKTCAQHAEHVIKHIKGKAKDDIQKYICGTDFVTKYTVMRHLSSTAHKIALEQGALSSGCDKSDPDITGVLQESDKAVVRRQTLTQPKINSSLMNSSKEAYTKLFNTAYILAIENMPFKKFQTLVTIQKMNGVQLISNCEGGNRAREFVGFIAQAVRNHIKTILTASTVFTLLTDGSQARKTQSEKELVFIRIVKSGVPTFYCAALENVDNYGDATASNLKKSIDSVFSDESKIPISDLDYTNKLICFTSDGASVNTGKNSGLIKQMRDTREWLISIHCVLHRIELAVKESMMKISEFKSVHDFMVLLYYHFKRTSKLPRHLKTIGEIYNIRVYKFKKVHGTRFVSHEKRGLETLLENWIPLAAAIEDKVKTEKDKPSIAKVKGILNKLKDFSFLCITILYLHIISTMSTLSLSLERDRVLVTEVMPAVDKTISVLTDEIMETDYSTKELALSKGFRLTEIPSQLVPDLSEHGIEKEYTTKDKKKIILDLKFIKTVEKSTSDINKIKNTSIQTLCDCLRNRFEPFTQEEIYLNMSWVDPSNWTDTETELRGLAWCANKFEIPLKHNAFDKSKIQSEWKDLKLTVKYFYQGVNAFLLWEKLLTYSSRRQQFPNICILAEIILCLGPSTGVVESGFSYLTAMLTDTRLSISHKSMEDLLLIKVNDLVWNQSERESIIQSSVDNFLSKRRKTCFEKESVLTRESIDVGVNNDIRPNHKDMISLSNDESESDEGEAVSFDGMWNSVLDSDI